MKSNKNIKSIVVMAILGITALFFINISFAANTAKINVETANLRETANSEAKIIKQLSQNEKLEIIEKTGEWYKVKSGDSTGYIRNDLLLVENEEENTVSNTVVAETATENTQTTEVAENTVESNNQSNPTAVETTNVADEKEEKIKIVAEDTKLKIVPVINATDIVEVKKDEKVEIIETINGWVCIQTQTAKGWIRSEKLKSETADVDQTQEDEQNDNEQEQTAQETLLKTVFIASETVNLRKEASTDSEIVAKLTLNMAVDVYSEEGGWSKIKVSGKEGYVSTSLLSDKKKETSRAAETLRNTENTNNQTTTSSAATVPVSQKGGSVVETAKNYIGKASYVYGASGPSSFDCSGFTSYIYKQYGVSLSRTAAGQYSNGVAVSKDQLQPGDLVMFGKSGINHVGIYIGGGQMVHAANPSRGVTTDTINSGYYGNNYVGARRVN